jgi:hypothetical protein
MKPLVQVTMVHAILTTGALAQDPAPYTASPRTEAPVVLNPIEDSDAGNLLKNGSFEYGDLKVGRPPNDWGFIIKSSRKVNGGVTEIDARSGIRSLGFGTPFLPSDKWQVLAFNIPVEKGATYEYSAWIKAYPGDPLFGGAFGVIQIEWKDASGNELDRLLGESWDQKDLTGSGWIQRRVMGRAPAGARSASFVITYHLNSNMRSGGSFLIDDARVVQVVQQ